MAEDFKNKYSTIYYSNSESSRYLILPTIQSLSIPDSSSIPSRPTITGEYRNQFVSQSVKKITFIIWLEDGFYGQIYVDVAEVIAALQNLKEKRTRFNLTTSHANQESQFMSNLVIENISYARDAANRDRIVATVNATQVRLVDLAWVQTSSMSIFGQDIFTDDTVDAQKSNMSPDYVADTFGTKTDFWQKIRNGFTDPSNLPVNGQIYDQIKDDIPLNDNSFFFKLDPPIDLAAGNKTYSTKASFTSSYATGGSDKYNVDVADLVITVQKHEAPLVANYPLGNFVNYKFYADHAASKGIDVDTSYFEADQLLNNVNMTRFPYDTGDTYPSYGVSKSFESMETTERLAEYLKTQIEYNNMTEDPYAVPGSIMIKNGWVYTKLIKQRYSYDIKINGNVFNKHYIPSGGLDVTTNTVNTTSNHYSPTISNSQYQEAFQDQFRGGSGSANYNLHIVAVTLGTMLQVYLFSDMFNSTVYTGELPTMSTGNTTA